MHLTGYTCIVSSTVHGITPSQPVLTVGLSPATVQICLTCNYR